MSEQAAQAQVERWRDARLLVIAALEGGPAAAAEIIKRRTDGQHRDEVKLFVGELAVLAGDLGQQWENGAEPVLPVASLLKAQLQGPGFLKALDLLAGMVHAEEAP